MMASDDEEHRRRLLEEADVMKAQQLKGLIAQADVTPGVEVREGGVWLFPATSFLNPQSPVFLSERAARELIRRIAQLLGEDQTS